MRTDSLLLHTSTTEAITTGVQAGDDPRSANAAPNRDQPLQLHVPAAELQDWPLPAELLLDGQPEARGCILSQSADGRRVRGIWACSAGRFRWVWTAEEMVSVVEGHATVDTDDGRRMELRPGDMAFFPSGVRSVWTIHTPFRKAFHTFAEV